MNERVILFRGKRTDNGEWVEGFLTAGCDCMGRLYFIEYPANDPDDCNHSFVVDFSTVGRYTGLTDKNGKRIFEGDIVREYLENEECEYDYDCFDLGRVFWYQQCSRFLRTSKLFSDNCLKITECREYEVIGNIYDNPELLEVEDTYTLL